ncbi:MAG: TetR family transcriptional regulator [Mycobacterium sp.]
MDAAVECFAESGYGNVTLSEVIARASVTKGSLYYHFATKEALAKAIVDQSYTDLTSVLPEIPSGNGQSGTALENLIRGTFAMTDLALRDKRIRIGLQLDHASTQINYDPRENAGGTRELFAQLLERAVVDGDLVEDVDAAGVAHVLRCAMSGTYLMSQATGEDIALGMAHIWRLILRANLSTKSASFFDQLLDRTVAQYSRSAEPHRDSATTAAHPRSAAMRR